MRIISCMGTGNKLDPSKFEVTDINEVIGKRVLVFDDIYTTGNTIKESLNNIKTKKKLYLNKVKSLNTNINKNIIKNELNIPIKRINIINNPS